MHLIKGVVSEDGNAGESGRKRGWPHLNSVHNDLTLADDVGERERCTSLIAMSF